MVGWKSGLRKGGKEAGVVSWDSPRTKRGVLTQTLKFRFLYVTDSTLKPIVGIVVTTSPICIARQPHRCASQRRLSPPCPAARLSNVGDPSLLASSDRHGDREIELPPLVPSPGGKHHTFSLYNKVVLPALSWQTCNQHNRPRLPQTLCNIAKRKPASYKPQY